MPKTTVKYRLRFHLFSSFCKKYRELDEKYLKNTLFYFFDLLFFQACAVTSCASFGGFTITAVIYYLFITFVHIQK